MKKFTIVCMFVSLILMLTLAACAADTQKKEIEISPLELIDEYSTEDSSKIADYETTKSIIGSWVLDSVKFNNVVYKLDELEEILNEDAFNSLQLMFEFTKNEVTIYTNEDNKVTTGYKLYNEEVDSIDIENTKNKSNTESEVIKYIDESGQLIFTLVDNTLQIDQSQSTLTFIKQIKNDNVTTDTSIIHETE